MRAFFSKIHYHRAEAQILLRGGTARVKVDALTLLAFLKGFPDPAQASRKLCLPSKNILRLFHQGFYGPAAEG
jgi:hypothetical protein